MRRAALVPALLIACAPSIGPVPTESISPEPAPETKRAAQHRAERGSPYRVGDYVVYRYTGSYSPAPVVLYERVVAKNVFRLEIEVAAERAGERRQWVQVVIDTAENRAANRVEELYEVIDGKRKLLANVDNRDLVRLYEWTLPPCKGKGQPAGEAELHLSIAGARFSCTCKEMLTDCAGKRSRLETCDCPDFVWTHANAEARALDDAELIWKVRVERFGNARER